MKHRMTQAARWFLTGLVCFAAQLLFPYLIAQEFNVKPAEPDRSAMRTACVDFLKPASRRRVAKARGASKVTDSGSDKNFGVGCLLE
jgi:hypothetical protein